MKDFKVYHWDTFDNETILLQDFDTLEQARIFVQERYRGRISFSGADKVDIVDKSGSIVSQYSVC